MAESYRRGWHPDPYGLHAERFFYADNQPGRLVRDGNRNESYDDIPAWAEPLPAFTPPPIPTRITSEPLIPLGPPPLVESPSGAGDKGDVPLPLQVDQPDLERAQPDRYYFPDESVPWRFRLTEGFSRLRRHRRLSRTAYLAMGVGALVVVGLVLFLVLPSGSGRSPSAADGLTNSQLRVPGNFLNGGHPTTTSAAGSSSTSTTAGTTSWSLTGAYAASSLNLNAIACPTASQCYAVGETTLKSVMVLASSDGGSTWVQQNVPVPGTLNAVACASATTCMAVGGTTVISTSDGGTTWSHNQLGSGTLTTVSCPSTTVCVAAGSASPPASGCQSGETHTTSNAGQSWSTTTTPCFVPAGIACPTTVRCLVVGTQENGSVANAAVLGSPDGGSKWRSRYELTRPGTQFNAVSCPSAQVCVVVGNSPQQSIVRTGNGGATWVTQVHEQSGGQSSFLSVSCGSTQACQAGGTATSVGTKDGGGTWSVVSVPSAVTKVMGISCASPAACNGVATGESAAPSLVKLSS